MPSLRSRVVKLFVRLRIRHLLQAGASVQKVRRRTNYLASYGWHHYLVQTEYTRIGSMPVACFRPRRGPVRGSILFLHGGGYCFGSIKMYRDLAARLADAAAACVVLPEYRLSPEHRFPAALEDASAAWQWMLEQGMSAESAAIMGDSAGGGLALALTLSLRDAGQALPACLVCLSPWTDLACTGETLSTNADVDPMLPPDGIRECAARYCDGQDPHDPRISPLYGDLCGLPPLLIQVGTSEVLLADSTRLAEKARAADVETTLNVWDSMWHVWHLFAWLVPESRRAIREAGTFIQRHWQVAAHSPHAEQHNPARTAM
jgi:acetyl esterase/lipase